MTGALGWIGSALVVLSLTQRDVRRLRQISCASAVTLGAFNVLVGITSMIVLNVVLLVVNCVHLFSGADGAEPSDVAVDVSPRCQHAAGPLNLSSVQLVDSARNASTCDRNSSHAGSDALNR